jgi:aryl-alcohol dehydrogenase-like predicted oxidoreductase
MGFDEIRTLGSTGLEVGPLGLASSYGAPASAFEKAFERGCNYFYWGSMRKSGMRDAIRNICGRGKRDDIILVIQSYSRSAFLMESFAHKALKALGQEHADVLVLGWYNKLPSKRVLKKAAAMKEKGLVRFLALSGHKRKLFPELAGLGIFDIFHVRYNAAHRGAEQDIFPHIQGEGGPAIVSYTATRWGQLLKKKMMPPGEDPPSASHCYRFALSHPSVDVCVCGPKNSQQMDEALKTLELGPLGTEERERMIRIGDHVHAHGSKFFG